jgi:hypothetical protein
MTKSPTRESPPQANEEPPPRHRNIYDCDGEYEFPTVQHWTPDFAGRRDIRHSRASVQWQVKVFAHSQLAATMTFTASSPRALDPKSRKMGDGTVSTCPP